MEYTLTQGTSPQRKRPLPRLLLGDGIPSSTTRQHRRTSCIGTTMTPWHLFSAAHAGSCLRMAA
jgi:hypothetical protein